MSSEHEPLSVQALYNQGAAAYNSQAHNGFLQNPYLQGSGHETEAREWWRGYNAARSRARAHDFNAPS